nr:D-tyrosyl-tRNA(Tyr) deacylase [Bacilli bacterium]
MKVVIQRSLEAKVSVDGKTVGQIDKGMVILVGFTYNDTIEDIDYMINKIINMRIYDDENGVMNKSILEVGGSILSISQFTLYADPYSGRRPSYVAALKGDEATKLYDIFNERLSNHIHVEKGIFGADMKVSFTNDGPVTILLESRKHA